MKNLEGGDRDDVLDIVWTGWNIPAESTDPLGLYRDLEATAKIMGLSIEVPAETARCRKLLTSVTGDLQGGDTRDPIAVRFLRDKQLELVLLKSKAVCPCDVCAGRLSEGLETGIPRECLLD